MNLIREAICGVMLLMVSTTAFAHGDIKFHLQLSMQTSDAKGIAAYVEDRISFEYQDTRDVKSKAEVEKVMAAFFMQNKYRSFLITNQGTFKNGIRHMEGIYETMNKQRFQVYFEAVYDEKEASHHLSRMMIEKIGES